MYRQNCASETKLRSFFLCAGVTTFLTILSTLYFVYLYRKLSEYNIEWSDPKAEQNFKNRFPFDIMDKICNVRIYLMIWMTFLLNPLVWWVILAWSICSIWCNLVRVLLGLLTIKYLEKNAVWIQIWAWVSRFWVILLIFDYHLNAQLILI